MPTELLPEVRLTEAPDRILVLFAPEWEPSGHLLASTAVWAATQIMPKVTGHMVTTLRPIHGENYFGIYFPDRKVWFLESGTRPFTMHHVAGKTVPMWIDDPTGAERRANPKAKTRTTLDGRQQVLIFRKAALKGSRKTVSRRGPDGSVRAVSVPRSYPGAPGRIARREAAAPHTRAGRTGGHVAMGNVGVRWRHPGTMGRHFLNYAIATTAWSHGLVPRTAFLADSASLFTLLRRVGGT
jgi:hypothetical protein